MHLKIGSKEGVYLTFYEKKIRIVEDAWNEVDPFTAQLSYLKSRDSDNYQFSENRINSVLKVVYNKNNMSR